MITTDCPSRKVVYPSVKWAERFAGMFNQIGSFRQRAYRCPECGGGAFDHQYLQASEAAPALEGETSGGG